MDQNDEKARKKEYRIQHLVTFMFKLVETKGENILNKVRMNIENTLKYTI